MAATSLTRAEVEKEGSLIFDGFLSFHCKTRADSKRVVSKTEKNVEMLTECVFVRVCVLCVCLRAWCRSVYSGCQCVRAFVCVRVVSFHTFRMPGRTSTQNIKYIYIYTRYVIFTIKLIFLCKYTQNITRGWFSTDEKKMLNSTKNDRRGGSLRALCSSYGMHTSYSLHLAPCTKYFSCFLLAFFGEDEGFVAGCMRWKKRNMGERDADPSLLCWIALVFAPTAAAVSLLCVCVCLSNLLWAPAYTLRCT